MLKQIYFKSGAIALAAGLLCSPLQANKPTESKAEIMSAMKTVTQYMMDNVSYRGGFVWQYLPDLSRSWGEMEAKRTMVWIQPPGTPSVGHLLLDAYHATGDEYYYEAAEKSRQCLNMGATGMRRMELCIRLCRRKFTEAMVRHGREKRMEAGRIPPLLRKCDLR